MANGLASKSFVILSVVLLGQAGLFYGFSRKEIVPVRAPLADFSLNNTPWQKAQDVEISQSDLDVLQADDVLERVYVDKTDKLTATLFVAFFNTQRTGKAPHSPKNCLPGSGWAAVRSQIIQIPVSGQPAPIQANQYVVAKGDNQSVVLYWYESHNRTVASEYWAKYYTIADSIRYNRSDTALVRVVVGVTDGNLDKATQTAQNFAAALFPQLKQHLPA